MSDALKISDAASLALHTTVLLADSRDRPMSVKEIASIFHVSEAHLSKVLQRLGRAGLVASARGPKGGFVLGNGRGATTLLDVYEAIEGPMVPRNCLLAVAVCGGKRCILGGLLRGVNRDVRRYLGRTRLSDVAPAYRKLHRSQSRDEKDRSD